MAAADVDLLEVADAPVARRHRDVLELHVHVVLGLDQLAAVRLARRDLERDDVALCGGLAHSLAGGLVEARGDGEWGRAGCAPGPR